MYGYLCGYLTFGEIAAYRPIDRRGENDSRDDGRARLARLSFRALRSMARFPSDLERIREVRRLTNQPNQQPE
jgi:hypothetical protein